MAESVTGHAVLRVSADAEGVKSGLAEGERALDSFGNTARKAGKDAATGLAPAGTAGEEVARKLNKSQASMLESLKRQSMQLTEGKAAYLEYRSAQLGLSDAAAPYIAKIRATEQAQLRLGTVSKQTAAAMRMVPAQLTDVATQLAGGQNPLLILLQQGGQTKDMFGGFKPMFAGLATMMTPAVVGATALAAAVGSIGYAYYAGSNEADEFNKSLALTNGYIGMSISQMAAMSARIGDVVGTQGQAAEALALIAGSGKIAGAEVEHITTAAVLMERATGKAVADTVKEFSSLADAPAAASLKLNETYHYLTASVYEQIVALEKQGETQRAIELAQRTFADANEQMASRVVERLGYIQSAWKGIKEIVGQTVDAMKRIGRDDLIGDQIGQLERRIARFDATNPAKAAELREELAMLREQERLASRAIQQEKTRQENNDAATKAMSSVLALQEKGKSKQEQWNVALKKYRDELEAIRKANPNSEALSAANVAAGEESLRKSILGDEKIEKDPLGQQYLEIRKQVAESDTKIANIRAGILETDGQIAAKAEEWIKQNQSRLKISDAQAVAYLNEAVAADMRISVNKIEESQVKAIADDRERHAKAERDIAAIRATGSGVKYAGVADYVGSEAARKDKATDAKYGTNIYAATLAAKEQAVADQKNSTAAQYLYSLQEQEKSISRQIQLLGLSTYEQEKQQALWQAEDAFKKSTQGMSESDLAYQEQKTAYLQQQADILASIDAKRNWDRDPAAQSVKALQDYADQATNVGQQVASAWQSSFDSMADSLTNFLVTGKGSFSDFATSVIQDIIRIQMRSSVTGPMASALSSVVSSAFASWITPANASTTIPMQPGGGYAEGGPIRGAGTSTSDSIPAWLSNGEYVVKASAVNRVGVDFLDGINSGRNMRKYASGGLVTPSTAGNSPATTANMQVNVINQTGQQVAAESSQPRFDGEKMVVDVVLRKIATDRNFRQAVRGTA